MDVDGPVRELTPRLQLSVYRIVQESLTNVTKHAPGGEAQVQLHYGQRTVTVEIVNDCPSAPPLRFRASDRPGHGVLGMRERAELHGGHLKTQAAGHGWRVTAELPYESASR